MLTKEECNGLGLLTNNPEVWHAIEQAIKGFRRITQEHLSRDIELYQIYRDQGKLEMLNMFLGLPLVVKAKQKE